MCYLKEQQAAATCSLCFFSPPPASTLTFSPSYRPLSVHPTLSICHAASALKQCTNHCARSVTRASSPPVVQWDWLLLRAPGFPDNSQILGPLCGCQEQRALMIAHCHWSTARDTQAACKTRALFLGYFSQECWGLCVFHSNHPI